eukprot:ANDGO_08611.mRNA.1 COMM domain-containing protein 2
MLLILEEEQKNDLKLLDGMDPAVLGDFVPLAVSFFRTGEKEKVVTKAASMLSVAQPVVQRCLYGLSMLYLQCAKQGMTAKECLDSLTAAGCAQAVATRVSDEYAGAFEYLRSSALKLEDVSDVGKYQNLEWRLDVEISKRALFHTMEPRFVLGLQTSSQGKQFMECSYGTLAHIVDELETALAESTNPRSRRIQRYIK